MKNLMKLAGIAALLLGASSSHGEERYKAPGDVGISQSYPSITPVVRSEEWGQEEQNRIQTFLGADRTLSSEEEVWRPVLDLRRFPSSQGFGEQSRSSRLMLDNEWEIIWREKENMTKPQHWKYQSP